MKRILFVVCAVGLLSGCGGDVCSRLQGTAEIVNKNTAACNRDGSFQTEPEATCRTKLKDCNGEDQSKMHKWLDCVEKVPACKDAAGEQAYDDAVLACASSNLSGVSQACLQGIIGGE